MIEPQWNKCLSKTYQLIILQEFQVHVVDTGHCPVLRICNRIMEMIFYLVFTPPRCYEDHLLIQILFPWPHRIGGAWSH